MSRTLTKNTSNYLRIGAGTLAGQLNGAAVVSGFARVKFASLTTTKYDNCLLTVRNALGTDNLWISVHDGSAARLVVFARGSGGDAAAERISTATVTTGVWQSIGFVVNFAGDTITPYVNGLASNGGAVALTSAMVSGGSSNEHIGANHSPTTARQIAGDVAELAIWTRAVSTEEFAAMHAGLEPLDVSGGRPAVYYDLGRFGLFDPLNGRTLTVGGSVPAAEHPSLFWRRPRLFVSQAALVGPDLVDGPYAVAARQFHAAGAAIGEACVAGSAAGQSRLAGAAAGEVSV